jgi:HAD superfamily hydrolase (TIGR01509 family)
MNKLKALIFDVDGTLADTERDGHRVAFNRAFEEAGLSWHWNVEIYGALLRVTGGKERIRLFIEEYQADFDTPDEVGVCIRELHESKTRHFVALLQSEAIHLRPGLERLLREARAAGLRLGIATTTTPQNVTALLSATLGAESIGWFDVIAAGDVVPNKKPAPDIYQYALDQMGLTAADCLAFEDSDNGLQSSLNAGLKTIVTVNAYTRQQSFTGARIVLDQLGEPGSEFTVLSGDAGESTFVDIPFLKRVYAD